MPSLTMPQDTRQALATAGVIVLAVFAATTIAHATHVPAMLLAAVAGLCLAGAPPMLRHAKTLGFMARTLLRLGVALLGAKVSVQQFTALGLDYASGVAALVACVLAAGWFLAKPLKVDSHGALVAAASVAICGASAAAAVAAALPQRPQTERLLVPVILFTTLLSTIVMFIYPAIGVVLHLPPSVLGGFLGAAIHDVAQVAGAGFAVSQEVGETAMIVKLWRVALLLPAVLVVALLFSAQAQDTQAKGSGPAWGAILPWFLIVFVILAAANSMNYIPPHIKDLAAQATTWLLAIAIVAMGAKTSIRDIRGVGSGVITMILALSALIAVGALALAKVFLA